jgi:anti-anti-sigma factor
MPEIEEFTESNKSSLLFSGDLSVANAAELQQQLLKAAFKVSHIEVKVADVESMDLSFLQLLVAWAKHMKQLGKNLTFDFQLDQEFERIFDESGFRQAFSQL